MFFFSIFVAQSFQSFSFLTDNFYINLLRGIFDYFNSLHKLSFKGRKYAFLKPEGHDTKLLKNLIKMQIFKRFKKFLKIDALIPKGAFI